MRGPRRANKISPKMFSPEISYTKSGRGPLIFCPQRTKTRTFKTSIWVTGILGEKTLKLSNVVTITFFSEEHIIQAVEN